MIIYEMCEKGTLKDFLWANKAKVDMDLQESLFRFGLDIAKGMEHLAANGVTLVLVCLYGSLVIKYLT